MPAPDSYEDPYGVPAFPPPSYGSDLYRGAGGLDLGELLQQQQTQREAQQFNLQYGEAAAGAHAQYEAEAGYGEAQQNFIDWPTFQKDTAGTEPGRQYDGYLEALDWQLQQAGYSPEDAKYEVEQFQKLVPRPPEDKGFLKNLLSSATSGFQSGTEAIGAAGAAATRDDALLAKYAAAAAAPAANAPLGQFQAAFSPPPGVDPKDYGEALKRLVDAGFTSWSGANGMLNFFVQQAAQSIPVMAGAVAGGIVGTLGGPIGTVVGTAAGLAGPDFALDAGSTMLQNLVEEAQDRGIDPTDERALLALLQIPEVRDRVISDGVAHGLPVAGVDAAMSAVTAGAGGFVSRLLRGGRKLRASAVGAGAGLADIVAGPLGERLGQEATSKGFTSAGDVIAEGFGQAGPALASGAVGFASDRLRRRPALPGAPPPPAGTDINEADLPFPGGPEGGGLEPVVARRRGLPTYDVEEMHDAQPAELPTYDVQEAPIDLQPAELPTPTVTELPITEEINITADLASVPLKTATAEQLADYLRTRGVDISNSNELRDALVTVASISGPQDKVEAIADVVDNLMSSTNPKAERVAQELVKLAQQIRPRATPTAAQTQATLAAVAKEIGTTPEQVMPVLAQAAAEEIANAIVTKRAPAVTQATEAPSQIKRSLQRGEQLPATDLGSLAAQLVPGGPVQGQGGVEKVQGQPRRSLRAGSGTQGNVALPGGQRGIGRANQGGVGAVANAPERVGPTAPKRGIRTEVPTIEPDTTELDFTDLDQIEAEKMYEELYPGRNLDDDFNDISDPNCK